MYKTCQWCGVVPLDHVCPHKPKVIYKRKDSKLDRFRSSRIWQRKREEIKERDLYLCRACAENIPPTIRQYNYEELEVHHIVKLADDYERRLDNDNLITLCVLHHKMADKGLIKPSQLTALVNKPPAG